MYQMLIQGIERLEIIEPKSQISENGKHFEKPAKVTQNTHLPSKFAKTCPPCAPRWCCTATS